ncbi:hypothetical protein CBS101457_006223 [Exobasidium rhododendri]|nr:hypothetical protein CBS101457_006223 [Exobasidium rhododendri]
MLATARRQVNGKLRQTGFGLSDMNIVKDIAPRSKKQAKNRPNLTSQNTQPLSFAPFDPSVKQMRVSTSRIKQNQQIEAQVLAIDLAKERRALDHLTHRDGGPYEVGSQSRLIQTRKAGADVLPGDFVALFGAENEVGVIMPFNFTSGSEESSTSNGVCVLLSSGELQAWRVGDIGVIFPQFVASELAREAASPAFQIGLTGEAAKDVFDEKRLRYRAQICRRLRVLEKEAETAKQRLNPAFESLFLSDESMEVFDHKDYIRTPEVARLLIDHPLSIKPMIKDGEKEMLSAAVLLATHHLLVGCPNLFTRDTIKHRDTQAFLLRPAADRKAMHVVNQWVQHHLSLISNGAKDDADPIRLFSEKAREVIRMRKEEGRRICADQPGSPSAYRSDKEILALEWNQDDLVIINALRACIGDVRLAQDEGISGPPMTIAKCCGYNNELLINSMGQDRDLQGNQLSTLYQFTIINLLQDLGFITPWENLNTLNTEFRQLVKEKVPYMPTTATNPIIDRDERIRKDFTSPVYVIDDPSARELDDGIAIETTSDETQVWIHVLIADPTIGLQPGDQLAQEAKRRHSSHYHPDGYWPMIPTSFAKPYGIHDNKGIEGGQSNALRFSAKVDINNGKVMDISVGLSRLLNVQIKSYEEVSDVLKKKVQGGEAEADLLLLHRASIQLEKRRRDVGGAFIAAGSSSFISLEPGMMPLSPIWQAIDGQCPPIPLFSGFPRIHHRTGSLADFGVGPQDTFATGMVAEMMILAGRVAGAWARSKNLPILYRQQPAPVNRMQRQKILSLRDEKGLVSYRKLLQSKIDISSGSASIDPQEHFSMGINTEMAIKASEANTDVLSTSGYARVTSPLRRYCDMINHWQIKEVLRNGGSNEGLPFTSKDLVLDIPRQSRMDTFLRNNERSSHRYYMHLKLLRGLEARRGKLTLANEEEEEMELLLNQVHEAFVSIEELRMNSALQGIVRVQLSTLGLPALLRWDARSAIPAIGTMFHVKVTDVAISGHVSALMVEAV